MKPEDLAKEYYGFSDYVNRARWLTYFRQLEILLASAPQSVLEIGVGPGVVRAILRDRGVEVTTVDINPALAADYVADVRGLPAEITARTWDWVLCSRVLHHVPVVELESVVRAIGSLKAERWLLTVPREDLSIQVSFRRTAGSPRHMRFNLGAGLKRFLRDRRLIASAPSGLWMFGDRSGITQSAFHELLSKHLSVDSEYILADDPSHVFFVCSSLE